MKIVSSTIILNGKDMGSHGLEWEAAISNDLPGRFSAGSDSIPLRTGTIFWGAMPEQNPEYLLQGLSPSSDEWPQPGDSVICKVTISKDGRQETYTVFTGLIQETHGGMGEPLISQIVDRSQDFSAPVTFEPLTALMPRKAGTTWQPYQPGTHQALYSIAEVVKQAGYGVQYPDFAGWWLLNAHCNGSLATDTLRHEGVLVSAGQAGTDFPPAFAAYRGKRGILSGYGLYTNSQRREILDGFFIEYETYGLDKTSYASVGIRLEDGTAIALEVHGTQLMVKAGEAQETIGVIPPEGAVVGLRFPGGKGEPISARIGAKYSDTSLLRTQDETWLKVHETTVSPTLQTAPLWVDKKGSGIISEVRVGRFRDWDRTRAQWIKLTSSRKESRTFWDVDAIPAAKYIPGAEQKSGHAIIDSVASPFCISTWLDGEGILQIWSGNRLRSREASLRISESDFTPLSWNAQGSHACSLVTLHGKSAQVSISLPSGPPVQTAWQGPGDSLSSYQMEYFFTPSEGEDFFEMDLAPVNLNARYMAVKGGTGDQIARRGAERRQLYWHGWASQFAAFDALAERDEDGIIRDAVNSQDLMMSASRISARTWKIRSGFKNPQVWVPSAKFGIGKEVEEGLGISSSSGGQPILRAGAHVRCVDVYPAQISFTGPTGPPLAHDMGVYRSPEIDQYMQKIFGDYFKDPHPVISDVTTTLDPRIDVGKVIVIDATKRWGSVYHAQILHVKHQVPEGISTFTPRIIKIAKERQIYQDVADKHPTLTEVSASGTYSNVESGT